jgi:integrase
MARPRKTAALDLSEPVNLTAGTIERLTCPPGKAQAFLRDAEGNGLRVRVTPNGAKAFVFEQSLNNRTIRRTIGSVDALSIDKARAAAKRLSVMVDAGTDPRELERERNAAAEVKRAAAKAHSMSAREAWDAYLIDRAPHWGERHMHDHIIKADPGGKPGRRGPTMPGSLAPLLALPLRELDAETVEAWAKREAATRPTVARLAWRLLKAFLGWCAEQPAYAGAVPPTNPAKSKRAREVLGKPGIKSDSLQREQLRAWFAAVREIHNPIVAAFCQVLLLTGARPGEVLELQWTDLNTQWKGLTIRDKVEGERTVPLTPYVEHLLSALPRRSEWVFSGDRAEIVAAPNELHTRACAVAGIKGLTLHGLRRSFKSLTEWLDIPAGVVAQLMGHKPSATAERHYTVRPLDLLRVHHERIEAWILKEAGVKFRPKKAKPADKRTPLRLVTAA